MSSFHSTSLKFARTSSLQCTAHLIFILASVSSQGWQTPRGAASKALDLGYRHIQLSLPIIQLFRPHLMLGLELKPLLDQLGRQRPISVHSV